MIPLILALLFGTPASCMADRQQAIAEYGHPEHRRAWGNRYHVFYYPSHAVVFTPTESGCSVEIVNAECHDRP